MKTDLYYVVTPEFEEIDEGVSELTGNKDIDLYEILRNKPQLRKRFTVDREEISTEVIKEYIGEIAPELFNGEGKPIYTLTQL